MLFPACFQVGLEPLEAARCNLLCLKPLCQESLWGGFHPFALSSPLVKWSFFNRTSLKCIVFFMPRWCLSIFRKITDVRVTWTCRSSRWCYFPCAYFPEWHNLWGVGLVWFICWWWNLHFLSYTRTQAQVPVLHVQLDLGKNCDNYHKGVGQKWSGRTFLLPEQMLYYTTHVYMCPLRSVHQTCPWRLLSRRHSNSRLATWRRHSKHDESVCVTL